MHEAHPPPCMPEEDLRNNPEIREIFLAEARRRLKDAEEILKKGELPLPGSKDFDALHRHAHTLKGLGATLGYKEMEARSLDILDHLKAAARKKAATLSPEEARVIARDFECLAADVDEIEVGRGGASPAAPDRTAGAQGAGPASGDALGA